MDTGKADEEAEKQSLRGSWIVPPIPAFVTSFFTLLTGIFLAQLVWAMSNEFSQLMSVDRSTLSPFCSGVSLSYSVLRSAQLALSGVFAAVFVLTAFFLLLGRGWARNHALAVWAVALTSALLLPGSLAEKGIFGLLVLVLVVLPLSLNKVRTFYAARALERTEKPRGKFVLIALYGSFFFSMVFILWNNHVLLSDAASLQCLESILN